MSFGDDLAKFAKKARGRADLVVKKIVIDVATGLVEKSPVGDGDYWLQPPPPGYVGGRFRGNWQFALNAPDIETSERTDKTGAVTIASIVGKIPDEAAGLVHYITNSLPYAERLEDGWSYRQAPNGMVKLTVMEFRPIVAAATRALS